jgi:hypothetical protein
VLQRAVPTALGWLRRRMAAGLCRLNHPQPPRLAGEGPFGPAPGVPRSLSGHSARAVGCSACTSAGCSACTSAGCSAWSAGSSGWLLRLFHLVRGQPRWLLGCFHLVRGQPRCSFGCFTWSAGSPVAPPAVPPALGGSASTLTVRAAPLAAPPRLNGLLLLVWLGLQVLRFPGPELILPGGLAGSFTCACAGSPRAAPAGRSGARRLPFRRPSPRPPRCRRPNFSVLRIDVLFLTRLGRPFRLLVGLCGRRVVGLLL